MAVELIKEITEYLDDRTAFIFAPDDLINVHNA